MTNVEQTLKGKKDELILALRNVDHQLIGSDS